MRTTRAGYIIYEKEIDCGEENDIDMFEKGKWAKTDPNTHTCEKREGGDQLRAYFRQLAAQVCVRNFDVSGLVAECDFGFPVRLPYLQSSYQRNVKWDMDTQANILTWKFKQPEVSFNVNPWGKVQICKAASEDEILVALTRLYRRLVFHQW